MGNNFFKHLNKLQIVSLIVMAITFVACFFGNNIVSRFFIIGFEANMIGYLLFVKKWTRPSMTGIKKIDKQAEIYKEHPEKYKNNKELFFTQADKFLYIVGAVYIIYFLIVVALQKSSLIFNLIALCASISVDLIGLIFVSKSIKEVARIRKDKDDKYIKKN